MRRSAKAGTSKTLDVLVIIKDCMKERTEAYGVSGIFQLVFQYFKFLVASFSLDQRGARVWIISPV